MALPIMTTVQNGAVCLSIYPFSSGPQKCRKFKQKTRKALSRAHTSVKAAEMLQNRYC